eukprot:4433332-Alexandrium_andersonii.AAC.1
MCIRDRGTAGEMPRLGAPRARCVLGSFRRAKRWLGWFEMSTAPSRVGTRARPHGQQQSDKSA